MKDKKIKNQIDSIIRDEIQNVINEYVDTQENNKDDLKFVDNTDTDNLKVNLSNIEIDKIIKEYKKIKKNQKNSNLHQVKLLDSHGNYLK